MRIGDTSPEQEFRKRFGSQQVLLVIVLKFHRDLVHHGIDLFAFSITELVFLPHFAVISWCAPIAFLADLVPKDNGQVHHSLMDILEGIDVLCFLSHPK